jgi:hypothetical protein
MEGGRRCSVLHICVAIEDDFEGGSPTGTTVRLLVELDILTTWQGEEARA